MVLGDGVDVLKDDIVIVREQYIRRLCFIAYATEQTGHDTAILVVRDPLNGSHSPRGLWDLIRRHWILYMSGERSVELALDPVFEAFFAQRGERRNSAFLQLGGFNTLHLTC